MECPVCGSENSKTIKSKQFKTKKGIRKELVIQCQDCHQTFKESLMEEKPKYYNLIISEHEKSFKTQIPLFQNQTLNIGDYLQTEHGLVEITSIETYEKRENNVKALNIKTIWANSKEIPARFGVSIDLHGVVAAYKLETKRDFEIAVGDIFKLDKYIVHVHVIKTEERKLTKGFAKAKVIKRVYCRPIREENYDYNLTNFIVSKKPLK